MKALVSLLVVILSSSLLTAAEFYLLEDGGYVNDISADGTVAVGFAVEPSQVAWRWTVQDGYGELGFPDGFTASSAWSVSASNDMIAGAIATEATNPGLWTSATGWKLLPLPDGFSWGAPFGGMSNDGAVMVGNGGGGGCCSFSGLIWSNGSVKEFGEFADADSSARPAAISADGRIIAGHLGGEASEAFIWSEPEGLARIGRFRDNDTTVRGVSADGQTLFGVGRESDRNIAWSWNENTSFVGLGELGQGSNSYPYASTRDGSVIVGSSGRGENINHIAFVWDALHGMRDLGTVLIEEFGLQELSRRLNRASVISDDGRTIAGSNFDSRDNPDAWIITLDRPIVVTTGVLGDFNGNAVLDAEDLDLLANEVRSERTVDLFDVNSDGVVEFGDRRHWISSLAKTFFGDANLDGEFNSGDLVEIFEAGQYEDAVAGNSTWQTGDWNGDAEFNTSDLVLAFSDGGYELGPRVAAVPEPTSIWSVLFAFATIFQSVVRRNLKNIKRLILV